MRLLIIEDDAPLVTTLSNGFKGLGFIVDSAVDGLDGWAIACEGRHDLIILDRVLPGLDGLELLRRLRRAASQVPILLLTARDTVAERVEGLEAGADDYLVKPFALAELMARVNTLLRRGRHRADPVVRLGDLVVDTIRRTVQRAGHAIEASPREFQLLVLLIGRPDEIFDREEIHAHIAPHDAGAASNLVDVLVARLRRKLHLPGLEPILHTRRGMGYLLRPAPMRTADTGPSRHGGL